MRYESQFAAKTCTAAQAVSLIHDDDAVLVAGEPGALLEALYQARDRFHGLRLTSILGISGQAGANLYTKEAAGNLQVVSTVLDPKAWASWAQGNVDQVVVNFSECEDFIENTCKPTVLLAHCAPADEEGWFSLGADAGCASGALSRGVRVILQVNRNMPYIPSADCRVHINTVAALCEADEELSAGGVRDARLREEDRIIAGLTAERIPDGATFQLGDGPLPDLVGRHLVNHKDLGIHTDCFNGAMIELMQKGAVNNSKKELYRHQSVGGYFRATAEELRFLHNNPDIVMKNLSWICDSRVIRQMKGFISVNAGLAVDFRGQICSGSLGMRFSGGADGHLDFARGAKHSKGGTSFIVMRSVIEGEDGVRTSAICPALPEGSLVSIPRFDVMYLVTEFGAANLEVLSVKERVQTLISLAHPDFREQLTDAAKKHQYIEGGR
ncbi:MAG: hypothetical protein FWH28_00925 [Clostridiales bacterium]|nr:hypothetical protein [Clostridiales bacterium]